MHGNDVFDSEKTYGMGGFARAHGEGVADGKACELRLVEFRNQLHIAEEAGVAGVVDSETTWQSDDITSRFATVKAMAFIINGV